MLIYMKLLRMPLLLGFILFTHSFAAFAFSCTSNGVSVGGAGTFTIPVDVSISKNTSEIILSNMGTYTACSGILSAGYNDALRVTSSTLSSQLTAIGFTGFANIWGSKYAFPLPSKCIWPDGNCRTTGSGTGPVNVQIGIERLVSGRWNAVTIPAGTEIARFSVQQRGAYNIGGNITVAWGNSKTWIFTLKNPLIIPAYTCTVNNPNQTLQLPAIKKSDLQNHGTGRYPTAVPFNLNLSCDPQTTVAVQFDGTTISGTDDVLANTTSGNENVGVQVLYNNTPVKFGQSLQVIENSQAQEAIPFDAYYYYSGGELNGGPVTSVATFTFTYN